MSGGVFVTTYEVNALGLPIIEAHNAAVRAWLDVCWALTNELGGEGFQPSRGPGIRAILFTGSSASDTPPGWKFDKRDPGKPNVIGCTPRVTSKAGKALAARLAEPGHMPQGEDAAKAFGWSPSEMACDGNRIFFPTAQTIGLPTPHHFVRLPRFDGDGWAGHDGLTAVPESTYMLAIEAHNAALARARGEA